MHFAFVVAVLPHPRSNGWGMISWAIIKSLMEANHKVTLFCLVTEPGHLKDLERRAVLLELGISVVMVPVFGHGLPGYYRKGTSLVRSVYREFLRPEMATFFPNVALVPELEALLRHAAPDAVLLYHYDAIAATHGVDFAPRMAVTSDIWHWPSYFTWRHIRPSMSRSYLARTLLTLRNLYHVPKFMVKLMNQCEVSSCFGAYDAAWLRLQGATKCQYFRNPIIDLCGPQWEVLRKRTLPRKKPRILLGLSNLQATAAQLRIRLFAKEILPLLEHELGADNFEVHIIGEGRPPVELTRMLPRTSLRLRGRIEPADEEFLAADVLLAPTPVALAVRTHIISGFSFGCCVVAHTNEALNIPEMIHGENSLLASNGRGLAEEVVRAIRDRELRDRLGAAARKTYELCFAPRPATAPIIAELERIAGEWKRYGRTSAIPMNPDPSSGTNQAAHIETSPIDEGRPAN